jgi:isopentenyl-diphosphate Delta-isomerase
MGPLMSMQSADEDLIPAWVGGVLTPVGKLEVHRQGLRHKAVSVFVMRGKDVLIQRRALGKYHTPGLWANTCCTHPLWGEPAEACALRRLRQELGIEGLAVRQVDQIEYRAAVGQGMVEHELVDLFLAEAEAGLVVRPDPAEVMEVDWIDLGELDHQVRARPQDFTPWLQIYLGQHRGKIFGVL